MRLRSSAVSGKQKEGAESEIESEICFMLIQRDLFAATQTSVELIMQQITITHDCEVYHGDLQVLLLLRTRNARFQKIICVFVHAVI